MLCRAALVILRRELNSRKRRAKDEPNDAETRRYRNWASFVHGNGIEQQVLEVGIRRWCEAPPSDCRGWESDAIEGGGRQGKGAIKVVGGGAGDE